MGCLKVNILIEWKKCELFLDGGGKIEFFYDCCDIYQIISYLCRPNLMYNAKSKDS
jgi:hypothetical protein